MGGIFPGEARHVAADNDGPVPGPRRVPVKMCGLTRPEDAAVAVRLGASSLGVVFAGGPRLVTAHQAAEIVGAAGRIPVFGVFGSQGSDEILEVRERTGLTGAQLHGGGTPTTIERLRRAGMDVILVARLAGARDIGQLSTLRMLNCPLLVEPRVAGALGGSGAALSLDLALQARTQLEGHVMVLAGGLTPETVADVVRRVRPDAVDVSSGVEQIPGIKDHQRMARFLEVLGWV
jgi:phosphoribosylanthranilate isomerase